MFPAYRRSGLYSGHPSHSVCAQPQVWRPPSASAVVRAKTPCTHLAQAPRRTDRSARELQSASPRHVQAARSHGREYWASRCRSAPQAVATEHPDSPLGCAGAEGAVFLVCFWHGGRAGAALPVTRCTCSSSVFLCCCQLLQPVGQLEVVRHQIVSHQQHMSVLDQLSLLLPRQILRPRGPALPLDPQLAIHNSSRSVVVDNLFREILGVEL
eukprot:4628124-Prymnesium_polylepis.1